MDHRFTREDWNSIPEQLIYNAVIKEGRRVLADTINISIDLLRDWIDSRDIDIPVIRNANYYNARKPLEEQGAWEDDLSREILGLLEEARVERLKKEEEGIIEVVCPTCGKVFKTNKDKPQKYCSSNCVSNRIRNKEEKDKLSKSCIGRKAWNKGRKCTDEEKDHMSKVSKAVWERDGFKEKMSEVQKQSWSNRELLDKHKEIMKESSNRPEVRQKISEGLKEYYSTVDPDILTERYIKQMESKKKNGTLYESQGEHSINEFVESLGFKPEKFIMGKGENRFEIDCYIKEKKIGIEYNGAYYHCINGDNKRPRSYHINKTTFAMSEYGIELIQVWEDQWNNQREIIKDIIAARLGIIRGEKIYARKCEIRDVSTADYRDFCNRYHVQGYRSASVKLGLYYNNNLVQIASFNKARTYGNNTVDKYEWEWIRGCISSNNKVVGGTSKLLKYFIQQYNPKNILCFSDYNLFSGKGYEEAGFEFVGFTGPDKFFITNTKRMERINRNPYAYQQYKQMVKEGKLFECYGCGSKKFVWYPNDDGEHEGE